MIIYVSYAQEENMVYKGCEKRMIMIKNTGSELFEEAYFILNNKKASRTSEYDMVKEANRIVAENGYISDREGRGRTPLLVYLFGVLSGIGITGLVMTFIL